MASVENTNSSNPQKEAEGGLHVVSTKLSKEEFDEARKLARGYYEQGSISSPNLSQLLRLLVQGNISKYRDRLKESYGP